MSSGGPGTDSLTLQYAREMRDEGPALLAEERAASANAAAAASDAHAADIPSPSNFHVDYGTSSVQQGLIPRSKQLQDSDDYDAVLKQRRTRRSLKITAVVLLLAATCLLVVYLLVWRRHSSCQDSDADSCGLLCTGVLLQTVQLSGLFNDSKTFVDMPLQRNPQCVQDDFDSMTDFSKAGIYDFLVRNFESSCSDMSVWSPPDYSDSPAFLERIVDPTLREWAGDVHDLWNLLGRKLDPDVYAHPKRHTLLPLRSPNMIVPGGRFCEFYYWDSFWIIEGLLVSGMVDTARGIVDNFIGMVEDYGFVPNGSRKYYLNRSQPPMLTMMVKEVFDRTQDLKWLASLLPALEREYLFWMTPGERALNVTDSSGNVHTLNRYFSNSTRPRPESFVADRVTAWLLHNMTREERAKQKPHESMHEHKTQILQNGLTLEQARRFQSSEMFHSQVERHSHVFRSDVAGPPAPLVPDFSNDSSVRCLFAELTAGAESGWDFSSRWFHDRSNLTSVETMDLIPVDLNAILFAVERQLAEFFDLLDKPTKAAQYRAYAAKRMRGIQAVLWSDSAHQWLDYHIDQRYWKAEVVLSNFVPLWAKCYDPSLVDEAAVISALLQSGLVLPGGLVTTLNNNTQQWDFPNAWAPLQWLIIRGIETSTYLSSSTPDNFQIYNSSDLAPGEAPPQHACDVVQPETWLNCSGGSTQSHSGSSSLCRWCFPSGPELGQSLALQWLLTNYIAYNETGYMLEKYFAPAVGWPGAGGEYQLQKGFGWTNGVALAFLDQHAKSPRLNLTTMLTRPYPYAFMAAGVDSSSWLNAQPPSVEAMSRHPVDQGAKPTSDSFGTARKCARQPRRPPGN